MSSRKKADSKATNNASHNHNPESCSKCLDSTSNRENNGANEEGSFATHEVANLPGGDRGD